MARVSKYEGGSKLKSFRLPLKYFKEANAAIEQLLSKYEKPTVLNIVTTGKVGMNVQNPNKAFEVTKEEAFKDIKEAKDEFDFEFLSTATRVSDGVNLSGKAYYDLNMSNIPSEKTKELFLAARPLQDLLWKLPTKEEHESIRQKALPFVNVLLYEIDLESPDFIDKVLKSFNRPNLIIWMEDDKKEK